MKGRCTLWIADGRLNIRSDYDENFVPALKNLVPAKYRSWKPPKKDANDRKIEDGLWTVDPSYLDEVHALCDRYYTVTVIAAEQVPVAEVAIIGDPYSVLCSHANSQTLKAFYRQVALDAHPDRNSGNGSKMAEVNAAWNAIKKVRGL